MAGSGSSAGAGRMAVLCPAVAVTNSSAYDGKRGDDTIQSAEHERLDVLAALPSVLLTAVAAALRLGSVSRDRRGEITIFVCLLRELEIT